MCWCKSNNFCMILIFGKNIIYYGAIFQIQRKKLGFEKIKKKEKIRVLGSCQRLWTNKRPWFSSEFFLSNSSQLGFQLLPFLIVDASTCIIWCKFRILLWQNIFAHLISLPCAWFVEMKDMTWKSMVYWELVLFLA